MDAVLKNLVLQMGAIGLLLGILIWYARTTIQSDKKEREEQRKDQSEEIKALRVEIKEVREKYEDFLLNENKNLLAIIKDHTSAIKEFNEIARVHKEGVTGK